MLAPATATPLPPNLNGIAASQQEIVDQHGEAVELLQDPEYYVWLWPHVSNSIVWLHSLRAYYTMETRLFSMRRRGVALQAGGCLGVVPGKMAPIFDKVITFELDPQNYAYLEINCGCFPNIVHRNVALGENGSVGLERAYTEHSTINHGGSRVSRNNKWMPSISIDSLNLPELDALILDAEASEPTIIKNSLKTIARCRPELIVCETIDDATVASLKALGYARGPSYGGDASFELVS